MVDWSDPWILAQAAYPLVGMIVWMWIMGPIGMWESPFLRLALFLLNPMRITIPATATPKNVTLLIAGAIATLLLLFATFIFWPVSALFALGWLAWPHRRTER